MPRFQIFCNSKSAGQVPQPFVALGALKRFLSRPYGTYISSYPFPPLKRLAIFMRPAPVGLKQFFTNMPDQLTTLYRPVGQAELELIRSSGFRGFPPRLPEQPFFYPVLNEEYATQIARDWNTKDEASGFVGYVLRFQVRTNFLANYEIHQVGGAHHREYWIPAAELDQFNANIVGCIEVLSVFRQGQKISKRDP